MDNIYENLSDLELLQMIENLKNNPNMDKNLWGIQPELVYVLAERLRFYSNQNINNLV